MKLFVLILILYPIAIFGQCFDKRYKEITFVETHREKSLLIVSIHFKEKYKYGIRYGHNHINLFVSIPNSYFMRNFYEDKYLQVKDMAGYTHIVVKRGKLKRFKELKRMIKLYVVL